LVSRGTNLVALRVERNAHNNAVDTWIVCRVPAAPLSRVRDMQKTSKQSERAPVAVNLYSGARVERIVQPRQQIERHRVAKIKNSTRYFGERTQRSIRPEK